MRVPVAAAALASLAAACGGGETRHIDIVRVDPPGSTGCAVPAGVRDVKVSALGDVPPAGSPPVPVDQALAIDTFPGETREIAVELLGVGGSVSAVGRSGTLELSELLDGDEIPVYVAPPRGFCPAGSLVTPRAAPIVVRAGARVLVVGGETTGAAAATGAELYDPATGVFEALTDAPFDDLRGGRGVALADGRVLLTWPGGYQIFDPATRAFGLPILEARLLADPQLARVADPQDAQLDGRVVVAGGGSGPAGDATLILDPISLEFSDGPALARPRAGGVAFATGDGRLILAGGWSAPGAAQLDVERWDPDGEANEIVLALGGTAAPLPGGGLLAGFAAPGAMAASDQVVIVPPAGAATAARTATPARVGVSLTLLDDGAVLVLGGSGAAATDAELYRPHAWRFDSLGELPGGARAEAGAVLLADGSVLVVGGRDPGGAPLATTLLYRHDLTGPWSSVPAQVFVDDESAALVVPADPDRATLETAPPRLVLDASPDPIGPYHAIATLAGPQFLDFEVLVVLSTTNDAGAALLAGGGVAIELAPGAPARARDAAGPLCTGAAIPAGALDDPASDDPHDLRASYRDGHLLVTLDATIVLDCSLPVPRGSLGIALMGASERLALHALIPQR